MADGKDILKNLRENEGKPDQSRARSILESIKTQQASELLKQNQPQVTQGPIQSTGVQLTPVDLTKNEPAKGVKGFNRALEVLPEFPSYISVPEQETPITALFKFLIEGGNKGTKISQAAPEFSKELIKDFTTAAVDKDRNQQIGTITEKMRILAQSALTFNPDALGDTIKKAIPEAEIVKDEKGNKFVRFPKGSVYVLNRPGASMQDGISLVSELLAHGLTTGRVAASKIAKPFVKLAATSATAMATELGQNLGSQALGSEQPIDKTELFLAGVFELIPGIFNGIVKNSASKQNLKNIERRSINTLKGLYDDLRQGTTVKKLSDSFINNSIKIIDDLKKTRAVEDSPLFTAAFDHAKSLRLKLKVQPIVADLLQQSKPFRLGKDKSGLTGKNIKETDVKKFYDSLIGILESAEGNLIGGSNVEALHQAKRAIQSKVDKLPRGVFRADMERVASNTIRNLKNLLTSHSDGYKLALEKYATASNKIAQKEELFSKVLNVKGDDALALSDNLFSDTTSIETIRAMKKITKAVDPEAWDSIIKARILKKGDKLGSELEPGRIFESLIGDQATKDLIFEAMDLQQRKNFTYFNAAMKAKEEAGGLLPGLKSTLLSFYIQPVKGSNVRLLKFGGHQEVKDKVLAELMFSKELAAGMEKLRKTTNDASAIQQLRELLNDASSIVADKQLLNQITRPLEENLVEDGP